MGEKASTLSPEPSKEVHRIPYEEFQSIPWTELQALITTSKLIVTDVRPWDLFASQVWTDDDKLVLADADQAENGDNGFIAQAFVYEEPSITPNRRADRRLVLVDKHHRTVQRWVPDKRRSHGQGLRFDIEVREGRELDNMSSPPERLGRYRTRHSQDFHWQR